MGTYLLKKVGVLFIVGFFSESLFSTTYAYDLRIPLMLMDGGEPIITALDIRVSLWDTYDVRNTDFEVNGNINTSALHYGQYQAEFTIIPDQNGYFVPVTYGLYNLEISELPNFPELTPFNAFLQVEYKPEGSPNTDYEIYDFINDPPFQNVTRFLLDEHSVYYVNDAGPRTTFNTFTLDSNNNAPAAVTLQFGETLAKTLKYTIASTQFEFNDDVSVSGGLAATGVINFQTATQFFVPQGAADPASCSEGQQFYNTTSDKLKICTALNTWKELFVGPQIDHLIVNGQTNATSYTSVGSFAYLGTNSERAITAFKGILYMTGATNYSARIQDVTNNQTIAQVTGQTNSSAAIVDFGAVSNLPSGAAIFEIQMLRSGGLVPNAFCDALTIVY